MSNSKYVPSVISSQFNNYISIWCIRWQRDNSRCMCVAGYLSFVCVIATMSISCYTMYIGCPIKRGSLVQERVRGALSSVRGQQEALKGWRTCKYSTKCTEYMLRKCKKAFPYTFLTLLLYVDEVGVSMLTYTMLYRPRVRIHLPA